MGLFTLFKKTTNKNSTEGSSEIIKVEGLKSCIAGIEFIKNLEYHKAKECFDLAIEKGYKSAVIFKYRGFCLQENNMHSKAIDDFNQSALLDPTDWELFYFRETSLDFLGKYEERVLDLTRVIEILQYQKQLDNEENSILSSIKRKLKFAIQLAEIQKKKDKLNVEWDEKLKETRENYLNRNKEKENNNPT